MESSYASIESFQDSPRTPAAAAPDTPDLRLLVRRRSKPEPMPMETVPPAPGPARRPRSPDSAEKDSKRPNTRYSDATASQEDAATDTASAEPAASKGKKRYPPIVVEELPHFAQHLRELKTQLGRSADVRPYGNGLRFIPRDEDEYRLLQAYFTTLESQEGIAWHSYSPPSERGVKVAIRGLPTNATPDEIADELRELGFDPEYTRPIRGRGGRPGCIFLVILRKTQNVIPDIYEVRELLGMPGIKIEAWRGKRKPAQCHRCQQFRHSSHHCHRTQACVRCGGEHAARDCPRPREQPATCINCSGDHPANHFRCPVFRREARNRKAGTAAVTSGPHSRPAPVNPQPLGERQGASLMAEANAPSTRGEKPAASSRRRRRRRGGRRSRKLQPTTEEEAATPAPPSRNTPPVPPEPVSELVEVACQTEPTPTKETKTQTAAAASASATSPSVMLAKAKVLLAEAKRALATEDHQILVDAIIASIDIVARRFSGDRR